MKSEALHRLVFCLKYDCRKCGTGPCLRRGFAMHGTTWKCGVTRSASPEGGVLAACPNLTHIAMTLLLCAGLPAHGLRVAVVQLRIDESTYSDVESFRRAMTAAVEKSLDEAPEGCRPDLIVFPEYTSVFLALLPYEHDLRGAASVADGLARLSAADSRIGSLRQVFLEQAPMVHDLVCEVFGGLART